MRILFAVMFAVVASLTVVGQTKKVAILETVDREGGISYGIRLMIRSELSSAITKTPGYEGYSRTDIDKVMSEHDFQRTGLVNDEQIKQLGEMSGAQYILIAEVAKIDYSNIFITASIINVETAKLEKTSNIQTGTEASQLKSSCESLASQLFAAVVVEDVVTETTTEQMPDSSAEELYNKGYSLFIKKKYDDAIVLLDQAARLDHREAQYTLGMCYKNGLGTCEDKDIAIQWFQKAAKQGHKEAKKMVKTMKLERFAERSKNSGYNAGNMYMQPNNRGASLNFHF